MSTSFKIGDIVFCTKRIERYDHRSVLNIGEKAKITEVFQLNDSSPQIVGIEIEGKLPMRDIVCYENKPFELW